MSLSTGTFWMKWVLPWTRHWWTDMGHCGISDNFSGLDLQISQDGGKSRGYLAQHQLFDQVRFFSFWNDKTVRHYLHWSSNNKVHFFITVSYYMCLDTRVEGRHSHPRLLLSGWRRWGWHHHKCMVWTCRHCVSATPGSPAELPGSGEAITFLRTPMGLTTQVSLGMNPRWLEASTSVCFPLKTRTSSTRISRSFFTIPVRWVWRLQKVQIQTCTVWPFPPQVEVENPNAELFPEFSKAPYLECVLEPGDVLFIPVKHWHYVRSLQVSFSVSFWWSWRQISNKNMIWITDS